MAQTAFQSGEIDGLRLLIDSSQLPLSHKSYLSTSELMKIFNESTKNLKLNTLGQIKKIMYKLEWNYSSMKWGLSEEALNSPELQKIIASDNNIASSKLEKIHDSLENFNLSQWQVSKSQIKSFSHNPFDQDHPYTKLSASGVACRFVDNGPNKVASLRIKPGKSSFLYYPIKHSEDFDNYQLKDHYTSHKSLKKGHEMGVSVVKPLKYLLRSHAEPNKIILLQAKKIDTKEYQLSYKVFKLNAKN
ncbi:hypothetical protein LNTAR_18445 [Lentisphaera araneosa HTCC2155]|uniref:Uncharacterized protein n=1 Tax=Lentisphaera araneosa HTCC2155 TaxID=313628 RepID=A6DNJ5_9BACT|nr:hypothetical protein [Lentisphaera araneosa]EDM26654.1 hypothetical protein LNTAR_18445 [Lentisphaera araneosa HTCC2155]